MPSLNDRYPTGSMNDLNEAGVNNLSTQIQQTLEGKISRERAIEAGLEMRSMLFLLLKGETPSEEDIQNDPYAAIGDMVAVLEQSKATFNMHEADGVANVFSDYLKRLWELLPEVFPKKN